MNTSAAKNTHVAVFLTILFWASAFVGIRAALKDFTPIELAVARYMIASLVLLFVALFQKVRIPDKQDLIRIISAGLVGIAIYNIALNYGEMHITAGEACLIVNTAPLFTALLAYLFLGEKMTRRFIFGMVLSFSGVLLIVLSFDARVSLKPNAVFVLMAAISHAAYFILQKPLLQKYRPIEVTSYAIWTGFLLMAPLGFELHATIRSASIHSTLAVVYLGIFPAAVAYLCWSIVLSKIAASTASSFLYAVPVVVMLIGLIWLKEFPPWVALAGGVLAIGGVVLTSSKIDMKKILRGN